MIIGLRRDDVDRECVGMTQKENNMSQERVQKLMARANIASRRKSEEIIEEGRVQVNGKAREIDQGLTVRGLLDALELHPGMVVVELNRKILERDTYDGVDVSEGDTIELVHFVGGG